MKLDERTRKKVETIVGDAYDVGHTHGTNPMRMMRGEKMKSLETGWGKQYEKMLKVVEGACQQARDDALNELIIWVGETKDETAYNQWQIRKTTIVAKLHSIREK